VPFVITTGTNPLALDLVREATFAVRFGIPPLAPWPRFTAERRGCSASRTASDARPGQDADLVVLVRRSVRPGLPTLTVVVDGITPQRLPR